MSELSNPHDKFFKETFSRPEVARDFLQNYLPQQVVALLDLDTLQLQKDSFIDQDLREHYSDLLYTAQLRSGQTAYVYTLLEHKSFPDLFTAFQLLRYLVRIWEQELRQGGKTLSPVIPLVVYHGREPWRVGTSFSDLFIGPDELRVYWPDFAYQLCDLSAYAPEEIRGAALMQIGLRLMKHIYDDELTQRLPEIFALFRELTSRESALQYLETVLRYLSVTAEKVTSQALREAVETAFTKQGGKVMPTLAEQWIQEGLEQGKRQAMRDGILELLEIRFGLAPDEVAEQIEQIENLETLRLLHRQAATADSLSAFEHALTVAH